MELQNDFCGAYSSHVKWARQMPISAYAVRTVCRNGIAHTHPATTTLQVLQLFNFILDALDGTKQQQQQQIVSAYALAMA